MKKKCGTKIIKKTCALLRTADIEISKVEKPTL